LLHLLMLEVLAMVMAVEQEQELVIMPEVDLLVIVLEQE